MRSSPVCMRRTKERFPGLTPTERRSPGIATPQRCSPLLARARLAQAPPRQRRARDSRPPVAHGPLAGQRADRQVKGPPRRSSNNLCDEPSLRYSDILSPQSRPGTRLCQSRATLPMKRCRLPDATMRDRNIAGRLPMQCATIPHPLHPTLVTGCSAAPRWRRARSFPQPARSQPVASESRDETHGCRYVKLQVWTTRAVQLSCAPGWPGRY
jgi:hypothetical protein